MKQFCIVQLPSNDEYFATHSGTRDPHSRNEDVWYTTAHSDARAERPWDAKHLVRFVDTEPEARRCCQKLAETFPGKAFAWVSLTEVMQTIPGPVKVRKFQDGNILPE